MVADEFYNGKLCVDLFEEDVMEGLKKVAGIDVRQTSDEDFGRYIFRVLKMDASFPVDGGVHAKARPAEILG